MTVGIVLWNLISLFFGGPILGTIIGYFFSSWMGRIVKDGTMVVSITFVTCFGTFFLCEYPSWEFSGILGIVAASIILSYTAKIKMIADRLYLLVETIWKFA